MKYSPLYVWRKEASITGQSGGKRSYGAHRPGGLLRSIRGKTETTVVCLQLQQASAEQTQESAATLQTAERPSKRHRSWLGVRPTQPPPASPSSVGNQIQQSGSLGKTFYLYVTQFKELFSWQIAETSSLWECEASWGPVKSNSNNSLLFSAFEYQLVSKQWSTWSSLTANRFYWCESNWSNWTRRLCIKFAGWTNERGEKFNQLFNNHNSHPQYTQAYFKFIYICI